MTLNVIINKQKEGIYDIVLEGALDTETYISFKEKINPLLVPATKVLIFDMGKLNYISSAGLNVLFEIRKTIEASKGIFIMTNLQPQIKKVFRVIEALPGKCVFEDMKEVDAYLDNIQRKEIEKQKGMGGG